MSAKVRERTVRGAHARIAAEDERSGSKTGVFVLVIIFVALVAILLRLAEFAGRDVHHLPPPLPPAAAVFHLP